MSHKGNTLSSAATMSSVQALREFIKERLNAAAGEIFNMFEQSVVQYEEEIVRLRKLLEISRKPQIKFHSADLQQHHDCREEQLVRQETNYGQEQGEPELLQVKVEQEEPGLLQLKEDQAEPERPQIKEEPEEPGLLPFKDYQAEPERPQIEEQEELCTSQEGERLILKDESGSFTVPSAEKRSDPDTEQFLSHDSEVHDVKKHIDSESARNAELKRNSIFRSDRVDDVSVSEKQAESEKLLGEETVPKKHKLSQNLRTLSDKKLSCQICGKSHDRRSELFVHMRTHTGEKPYSCETCGKSFTQQNTLLRHMRTHSGEKPYSCETCGKSFNRQNNLLRHMRTHTGEKPYSCETCGKRFSQHGSLRYHGRTHQETKS